MKGMPSERTSTTFYQCDPEQIRIGLKDLTDTSFEFFSFEIKSGLSDVKFFIDDKHLTAFALKLEKACEEMKLRAHAQSEPEGGAE